MVASLISSPGWTSVAVDCGGGPGTAGAWRSSFFWSLQGREDSGRLRTPGTPHLRNKEQRTPQPQDVKEGEVEEVVEIFTTTGDVQVVQEQSPHFTSDSAQRLIQDVMWCSWDSRGCWDCDIIMGGDILWRCPYISRRVPRHCHCERRQRQGNI
ncbi:uncharacterized protein LOC143982489 [Lithobates pipiens]